MGCDRAGHPARAQELSHRRYGELPPRSGGHGRLAAVQITASLPKKGSAMKVPFAAALLALLPLAAFAQQSAGVPPPATESAPCAPAMGLNFVCGMKRPEDLLQI